VTPELSATLSDSSALLVRPVRADDVAVLHGLLASPDVGRWFHPRTLEQARDEWLDPAALAWALEVDGHCVGLVQVDEEDDPDYRHAALQVFVAPDAWGRGIAFAALDTVCGWLVGPRGHHRLTLDPERANAAALRLAERLGFRRVGVLERYWWDHAFDRWADAVLMERVEGAARSGAVAS
jgi:aminoglycoside 6'-N-acetyltransferase